jgi:hypothetical protein
VESNIEVTQKTKNRATILSSETTPRHIFERMYPGYDRAACTPMFMATIAKLWKQPRCLMTDE